ncbi:MAG: ABC transporter transmembrane domain-containing protein, partial [Hyphomicrobiaceae bacterium]
MAETDPSNDAAPGRRKLASPRQLRPLASLWPSIGRYPGMLAAAAAALVASAAVMLAVPVAIRGMIDGGFSHAASNADGGGIDGYFLSLIALGLGLAVASAARMYAVNWLGERVVADLRAEVFRHLASLGPAFYETIHSGEVMSRLTADTTQIKSAA